MPYIPKEDRKRMDKHIRSLTTELMKGNQAGNLNYAISTIFANILNRKGISYGMINEFVGVLECAKLEAYDRIARPYEDSKIASNGDVYPPVQAVILNCVSCGAEGTDFSENGECLKCVMKNAGFKKNQRRIMRVDEDIEQLADDSEVDE